MAALSGFAHDDSVSVEDFRVRSTDGAMIQSWIVKPAKSNGRMPVLFAIHGGPIGAFGDGWHWRWNALTWANAGYVVVLPNARGSTGFGQEFIQGIWRNQWGAQCYRDLMAVADEMATRSLSYNGALQDLGTLLHRIALAQTVPSAVPADLPEYNDIVRLASLFDAEEVQLYYQIAVHGRNELGLAPDEYAGFSMTLLRMLAFRPGVGGA